jgi:hypothetical protein
MYRQASTKKLTMEATCRATEGSDFIFNIAYSDFKSAHVLVNKERVQTGGSSLSRSAFLDHLCQWHAKIMANDCKLSHSAKNIDELKILLNSNQAGENIHCGISVEEMHLKAVCAEKMAYKNMMATKFLEFGAATARGKDGKLYMAQLFRGRAILPEGEEVVDLGDCAPCLSEEVVDLGDISVPCLDETEETEDPSYRRT